MIYSGLDYGWIMAGLLVKNTNNGRMVYALHLWDTFTLYMRHAPEHIRILLVFFTNKKRLLLKPLNPLIRFSTNWPDSPLRRGWIGS